MADFEAGESVFRVEGEGFSGGSGWDQRTQQQCGKECFQAGMHRDFLMGSTEF
jgi:hypothetical protein